jgi:glycosyltransferase involved in cell wall biosynthesis
VRVVFPILNISWHGGTRVLIQVANFLAEQGHEVSFVVSRRRAVSPFKWRDDVNIRHLGIYTGWKPLDYTVFLVLLPFALPRHALLIASFFVTYFPVRFAAALRGNRYIYFVQDIESKYSSFVGRLLNATCNLTYRDGHIIAANSYLRRRLLDEHGCRCDSIEIGPAEIFYTQPLPSGPKRYDVVYFLRRESWKGSDRFREFLELSSGRFLCLCVSQDEALFAGIAGPGVTCVKPSGDEQLIECIDSARVLFLTSYREGFALPPLECMARGVPSILFRCGGPDLYIQDGVNAIYVATAAEACDALDALRADEDRYRSMSANAIETGATYRMEAALRQFHGRLLDVAACESEPSPS